MRVLFYIDTFSMLRTALDAAEALRIEADAHVVLLLVDSDKAKPEDLSKFEAYDISVLFRRPHDIVPLGRSPPDLPVARGWRRRLSRSYRTMRRIAQPLRRHSRVVVKRLRRYSRVVVKRLRRYSPVVLKRLRRHSLVVARRNRNRGRVARLVLSIASAPLAVGLIVFFPRSWVRGSTVRPLAESSARRVAGRLRFLSKGSRGVRRFLGVVNPDLIVVLEDNIETISRLFVEQARRNDIPSIILPFTIPNPREAAQFYGGDQLYAVNNLLGYGFTRLFPRWKYLHDGKAMVRLPVVQALAYEITGYATPRPWVLNSGPAAAIALESEAMRSAYIKLGFPEQQLVVVGEPVGTALYRGLAQRAIGRAELCRQFGLNPAKRLVVCGMPPDQYSSSHRYQFEFADFEQMLEAWMTVFAELSDAASFIIRPHPRLDVKRLERHLRANARISCAPTSELIPLGDIYVASISATIRWAIACGVPVVNYDCYRYCYDDYATAAGVISVECLPDFRRELSRLVRDEDLLADVVKRQRNVMQYWGVVDDGFGHRFGRLTKDVFSRNAHRPLAALAEAEPPGRIT